MKGLHGKLLWMKVKVAHEGQNGPVAHLGLVDGHFGRFLSVLAAPDARLCQLLDVVHETVQVPLRVHLALAAQVEPVQPLVVPDVGKHRLHGAHALAVQAPASGRVDSRAHAVARVVRVEGR